MTANRDFLKRLVSEQILTESQCNELAKTYRGHEFNVLMHLVQRDPKQRIRLGRFWGDHIGAAYVDLTKSLIQYDLAKRFPEKFARKNHVIPLYEFGGVLTVATSTPKDVALRAAMENLTTSFVSTVFSFPDQIDSTLEIAYQHDSALSHLIAGTKILTSESPDGTVSADRLREQAGDQAVVEFTRGLMLLAVRQRASDIHVEPTDESVRVRFRVDGVLREVFRLDPRLLAPIVTRLKILADLNIAERRLPLDGRISLAMADRSIDMRFASVPTIHGEKVVLRVLGQSEFQSVPDISELCLTPGNLARLKRAMQSPNGVIYVTGPTGSGKTTTLYSLLRHLHQPGINIMTVEDPVEYTVPGMNQIQVNAGIGLTFAAALRSFLRQDPDIMLVGEIRDIETARIACQAALVGRLVLTTMHANSAIEGVVRLVEVGVEPFLVAPSLVAIIAQRLVRRLCDHCKLRYRPEPERLSELFDWDGQTEVSFCKPKGCEKCFGSGFQGRIAIHEMFVPNEEDRSLIARGALQKELREHAIREGFTNIRYDGLKKVLRGLTTIEEIERVTNPD